VKQRGSIPWMHFPTLAPFSTTCFVRFTHHRRSLRQVTVRSTGLSNRGIAMGEFMLRATSGGVHA
jgi:hypothetical protein